MKKSTFAAVCFAIGAVWLISKHTGEKEQPKQYEPWEKADTACFNFVHHNMGGSVFDISTGSNKDAGDNLFKVRVNVKKNDAVVSFDCLASGDGEIKEVVAFKVRSN